jgi:GNAT superfamily N-acetyltransferase
MDIVHLASGRRVKIRPIRPGDGPPLRAAYERLSDESKYRRFLTPKPHLTSSDIGYLVRIDGLDHVALVATPVDRDDLILAVARFVRLPEEPQTAEFSVVVGDPWQREGLATALMERLSQEALERGITHFRATMLADNRPAHALVARLAGEHASERHLGIVDELDVELAA